MSIELREAMAEEMMCAQGAVNVDKRLSGFDLENVDTNGIIQWCHTLASGEIHQIDKGGDYNLLTSQSTFADGSTPIADNTVAVYHSSLETQFSYWYDGKLVEETGIKTLQLTGSGYVYFGADGELHLGANPHDLITNQTLVAIIYWESWATTYFANERHGIIMDGATHLYLHFTKGFAWINGMALSGITAGSTTWDGTAAGICSDEDIPHLFLAQTEFPHAYREGSEGYWTYLLNDSTSIPSVVPGGTVVWNEWNGSSWVKTILGAGEYTVQTLIVTNDKLHPVVWVTGQQISTDKKLIKDVAHSFAVDLTHGSYPAAETTVLAYVIVKGTSGDVQVGDNAEVYVEYRTGVPVGRY